MDFPSFSIHESVGFLQVCKPPAEKPWDILGWSDILIEVQQGNWLGGWCIATIEPTRQPHFFLDK
jgi:hypothetical protein